MATTTREQRNRRAMTMQELDAEGVPRAEIARRLGVPRQTVSKVLGPMDPKPSDVSEMHVYATPVYYESAAEIAKEFGLTHRGGKNSGEGSVGKLIDKIGEGALIVTPNPEMG